MTLAGKMPIFSDTNHERKRNKRITNIFLSSELRTERIYNESGWCVRCDYNYFYFCVTLPTDLLGSQKFNRILASIWRVTDEKRAALVFLSLHSVCFYIS